MSGKRNKAEDRKNTMERMLDRRQHNPINNRNWLDHGADTGSGKIDELLLDGATKAELERARGRVENHLQHLKREHGLNWVITDGVYRYDIEGIEKPVVGRKSKSIEKDDQNYVPTQKDVENAFRQIGNRQSEISIDELLDWLEKSFNKTEKNLHTNWKKITERNLEMWFFNGEKKNE